MIECFSAPIADSENDSISDNEKSNREQMNEIKIRRSYSDPMDISLESTISSSLEDLISTFDEKIYKCFQDLSSDTTNIAPVCVKKELLMESDWWNMACFDEPERRVSDNKIDDNGLSTDGNNRFIISLGGNDSQSLRSAEGLLLEIHEMMDYSDNNADFEGIEESFYDSDLPESVKDAVVNFQCVWSNKDGSSDWQLALESLSVEALKVLSNDMKARVRTLSDCLLIHLSSRDELEFEREVRDRFMLLLQGVQRKKREFARSLVTQKHNAVQLRVQQKNRTTSRWSWNGNWGTMFRNQKMNGMDPDLQIGSFNKSHDDNNNEREVTHDSAKDLKTTKFEFCNGLSNNRSNSVKFNNRRIENRTQTLDATLKYLSTTIPFNPGVSSFNVHHLQIFNKILLAILQENSKLDNFLTEYILSVYTPSIDKSNIFPITDNCNNYQMDTICQ